MMDGGQAILGGKPMHILTQPGRRSSYLVYNIGFVLGLLTGNHRQNFKVNQIEYFIFPKSMKKSGSREECLFDYSASI
jgi:hypothetical protein